MSADDVLNVHVLHLFTSRIEKMGSTANCNLLPWNILDALEGRCTNPTRSVLGETKDLSIMAVVTNRRNDDVKKVVLMMIYFDFILQSFWWISTWYRTPHTPIILYHSLWYHTLPSPNIGLLELRYVLYSTIQYNTIPLPRPPAITADHSLSQPSVARVS
jgi:hypothetical protein